MSSSSEAVHRVQDDVDRWRRQMEAVYPEGDRECCGIALVLGINEGAYFTALFSDRILGTFSCVEAHTLELSEIF